MKIHYFQRYHGKENVVTANTMLLFSRLYTYSSDLFFKFLKEKIFSDNWEPELVFVLQEKNKSVPDATLTQNSYKIVIESKLTSAFSKEQLISHLDSFTNEKYKVLLTLDPNSMDKLFKKQLDISLKEHNERLFSENKLSYIIHKHITFAEIIASFREIINDYERDFIEILDDYESFCNDEGLIPDSWKWMRVQLAGTTLDINLALNLYYDSADRGFSRHEYLGLYKNKAVRAIGKIKFIVKAQVVDGKLEIMDKDRNIDISADELNNISLAIEDAKNYGYDLDIPHNYFLVEKFYLTEFKKNTPRAPMGSRFFDLTEVLETERLPETEIIAELLNQKSWQ